MDGIDNQITASTASAFTVNHLDLEPLESALSALNRGLKRALASPDDEELRDACIQRFEFTYELSWRMLKRRLELDLPTPDRFDGMSFRTLMRIGNEYGLIANPSHWFVYRDKRNITSHTYNAAKAAEVFAILPEFAESARLLLQALKEKENQDA
ncbi:MAG TPA: nucleotidyltransferase substrate binding protein [Rhodanobacteraceae bacterium]|nr:nucleotidyltransferase substrate binding protein [Rhodanobacteraceae bacterium]